MVEFLVDCSSFDIPTLITHPQEVRMLVQTRMIIIRVGVVLLPLKSLCITNISKLTMRVEARRRLVVI